MRINIYKQMRGFYSMVFESKYEFRPTHVSLYIFLLNQNNRTNWTEWFKCPFDTVMMGACINSNKTYYNVLNDLQSYKLIKYRKGINNYKAPQIHIIPLQVNDNELTKIPKPEQDISSVIFTKVTTLLSAQLSTQQCAQLDTHLSAQLSTHIDILLSNNYKIVISNKKAIKELPSLHSVLKNIFEEFYNRGREENLWYYWEAKDGKALQLFIPKLKKLCKGQEDKMPDTFRAMLEKNTDKWINERLAMPLINSKFNEIVKKITGSTDSEIEEFERKYYEQHG